MTAHRIAARKPTQRYVPYFTVTKLDGEYTRTVYRMEPISDKKDKNGNLKTKLVEREVTEPRGWLVQFPKGHSIHVATIEEMEARGYTDTEVPLVDEDGEAVGSVPNRIRKQKEVRTDA